MADLMTPSEAGRRLVVSAATVTAWVKRGKLAGVRTGNGHLADAAAVEALAQERAAHPPPRRPPGSGHPRPAR